MSTWVNRATFDFRYSAEATASAACAGASVPSAAMTRPPGPVPAMLARLTPICAASCLARGLAGTCPPALVVAGEDTGADGEAGAAAGLAAGAAAGAAGAGAGAAAGAGASPAAAASTLVK